MAQAECFAEIADRCGAAQDDSMGMGARKAFQELPNEMRSLSVAEVAVHWMRRPTRTRDRRWVCSEQLAATVFVRPTGAGDRDDRRCDQNRKQPAAWVLVAPRSIPASDRDSAATSG